MSRGQVDLLTKIALENSQSAQHDAQRAGNQSAHLANDIERLLMITEALWLLLKKEHGYTDEVLTDLINEIDLRDGVLNGRAGGKSTQPAQPCPACGKPASGRQPLCIYCGQPVPLQPFAR
jgi:hypothetical protein